MDPRKMANSRRTGDRMAMERDGGKAKEMQMDLVKGREKWKGRAQGDLTKKMLSKAQEKGLLRYQQQVLFAFSCIPVLFACLIVPLIVIQNIRDLTENILVRVTNLNIG